MRDRPKIVYIISMPRTGSTLAKRYLADHSLIDSTSLTKFFHAYELTRSSGDRVIVDKATRNMDLIPKIERLTGNDAWYLGVVRDPRDELASLLETDRHRKIPRDRLFWPYWCLRYERLLQSFKLLSRKGCRTAFLRYEDLAHHPVFVKTRFLNWLSLEVGTLSKDYYGTDPEIANGLNKKEDWKAHQNTCVHACSIGRWKELSGEQLKVVECFEKCRPAQDLMRKFGYLEPCAYPDDMPGKVEVFSPDVADPK